ncbi:MULTISPECIES: CoA transferase [unclassified Chelatococcus]|uniref:CaiB/BaiF CoA transferase family protein n=1 Tax=unclassified Chelatococcus TaxID=2638111 RepID=UPI001BCB4BC2|nr:MULTISPECIES: CoA transferase [unclassified Chelatococcus]MBS7701396.1 CoA transferase [Chelatococcus sp. YT9]MBX3557476.1 CoA transferase [Chelatococcus sp.]
MDNTRKSPLEGVVVLDLGQVYQGPYASFLLAQAGATVIKIEPPNGEPVRHRARISKGNAVPFAMLNANKQNISLNLKSPDGIAILKALAAKADILIENYAPSVMDRLGVGYEVLSSINPRLIYGTATGYGLSGPDRDNLAMDLTIQAVSGIISVTGFPDGPPVKAGPAITDFLSGVHLYAGILTALYGREKSGKGQLVEIAMVEAVYPAMASNLADVFNSKSAAPRTGSRHGGLAEAPYNVYPTSDGFVAIISVNESHWVGLTRAMGRPELLDDPRFTTVLDRLKHIDLTDEIVSTWSSKHTRQEVVDVCRRHKVPCAAVRDLLEVTQDRHLHERGMLREVQHPEYGDILVHRSPLVLHGAPAPEYIPSARLGQDNGAVLAEYLGLSAEKIEALRQSGAIVQA